MREEVHYREGGEWRASSDVPACRRLMRSPTSAEEAYRYHSRVLLGLRVPVYEDEPQAGWYRFRRARNLFVPAVIWIESETDEHGFLTDDEQMFAEVGGEPEDPARIWLSCAKRPISRGAFDAAMLDILPDVPPVAFDPRTAPIPLPF